MSAVDRVLIVGGGIGGLCAAIGLGRAGIACEVAEIQPRWSVHGVGIIQPANALRAYHQLGLAGQCLDKGFLYTRQRLYDCNGRQIGEREMPRLDGVGFYGSSGIARPALNDILVEAALALGTRIRLGTSVDALDQDGDGVSVAFADGRRDRFDLVIGADGLNSQLRGRLFPEAPKPAFSGQGCWRVTYERPPEMTWSSSFYGANKAGLIPLSRTSMYMFVTTSEPGNPRLPRDRLPELLRERLQDHKGIIGDLRDRIRDPDQIVYKPLESILVPTPWYRGRVLLIGDAAHTTTPHHAQGAAMAVEDAVVLAELMARNEPLQDLLAAFMVRRWERCRLVVEASLAVGRLEQSPTATSTREAIEISEGVRRALLAPA